ncbi:MAG: hypothetical protein WDW36_001738 [Sanguina aurantia]
MEEVEVKDRQEAQADQVEPCSQDEDDDGDETGSEMTTEDEDAMSVNGDGGKKKKKRKNKKKKGKGEAAGPAGVGGSLASNGTTVLKVDKQEADKRFNSTMEQIRGKSGLEWVALSACNIAGAKTKKLFDALKLNTTVTSLNLSHNQITDDSVQVIASMLGMHAAPSLLELDLRDNHFTAQGLEALEGLRKVRKQLEIKTGSMASPPTPSPPAAYSSVEEVVGHHQDLNGSSSSPTGPDLQGPMFRKYFQTQDDDEEETGNSALCAGSGEGELLEQPGSASVFEDDAALFSSISPEEFWSQFKTLLKQGTAGIPELAVSLQQLSQLLQRELSSLQEDSHPEPHSGDDVHITGMLARLGVLRQVLELVPRPLAMQFSKESPRPAIGSHRVWAAEIVAMLLSPTNSDIDMAVAQSSLVQQVLHLALTHPNASALHVRALRILRSCCVSKVPELYTPLFTSGLGDFVQTEGGELVGSLQGQLVLRASPALGVLSGVRDPIIGFIIGTCKVLTACCDANNISIYNNNIKELLELDAQWSEFNREDGVLEQLCLEQEGDLGGPRAVRMSMDDSDLADLAGGGLMSGHEILQLLQGMGAMNALS